MTLENLESGIKTALKIPVTESEFATVIPPPFVIYNVDETNNLIADSKIILRMHELSVFLCQKRKDKILEKKLENFFEESMIIYEKTRRYIDSQRMWQTTYEFELEE